MGLVHIYCGDGKGKTSAAVGAAIRFAGSGGKVLFSQFMKNGMSSELSVLKEIPGITVKIPYELRICPFYLEEEEKAEAAKEYPRRFEELIHLANESDYGMLVMDEIMSCISCGYIKLESVVEFIKNKPYGLEVIMTGRNPDEALLSCADYVSEIQKYKHPYDKGVLARKGIEY